MDREKAFVKALSQYRTSCTEVFSLIKEEEKARIRRWEDERPSLEQLVASLNQTCDILKKDKKKLAAELSAKQQSLSSGSAQGVRQGQKGAQPDSSSHHGSNKDPASLQRELEELNSRVQATDIEIKIAKEELATCERADEREYLSTKCVVLQDTRRILAEEMHALRSDLARLDASSRVEAERRRAEESGWAQVGRLDEAMERTTARLDRVKQQLYFPEAKGYRFSSGNGGIYVGARDLHVSEISGRFEFTCEPLAKRGRGAQAAPAGAGAAGAPARLARLTVVLGGVSASTALAERSDSRRGGFQGGAQPGSGNGGPTDPLGRSATGKPLSRSSTGGTGSGGGLSAFSAPVSGPGGGSSSRSLGGGGAGSSSGGAGAVAEGIDSPSRQQDPAMLPSHYQPPASQAPGSSPNLLPSPRPSPGHSPSPSRSPALVPTQGPAAVRTHPSSVTSGATTSSVPSTPIAGQQPASPGLHSSVAGMNHPLAAAATAAAAAAPAASPRGATGTGGMLSPPVSDMSRSPEQPALHNAGLQYQCHPLQPQQPALRPGQAPPPQPLRAAGGSGPPPSMPSDSAAAAAAAAYHRRAPSHDVAVLGGGGAGPLTRGLQAQHPPPPTVPLYGINTGPPPPARSKGEGVANFLSGLKNKKEKLKSMVGGLVGDRDRERSGSSAAGGTGGVSASSSYGRPVAGLDAAPTALGMMGGVDDGDAGRLPFGDGGGGKLRSQMMGKLQDGFSESKDKLSRIGKAIAAKAPEALRDMKTKMRPTGGRGPSGGGAGEGDWEEGVSSPASSAAVSQYPYQCPLPHQLQGEPLPPDTQGGSLLDALDAAYFGTPGAASAKAKGLEAGGMTAGTVAATAVTGSMASANITANSTYAAAGTSAGQATMQSQQPLTQQRQPGGLGDVAPGGAGGRGGTAGEAEPGTPPGSAMDDLGDDSGPLGGFVEDFECRPSRKGVYIQLLGERVELLGERGTKVPDMSIREIMLEVEVAATAVFEYQAAGGSGGGGAWLAPEPVSFNILQLDHRMRGNNIPLPRTFLRGLLNAYIPGVLTRLLSGLLPAELGAYTMASGETQALSGEFKVAGPSLSTTITSIAPPPKPPSDTAKRAKWAAAQAAAGRARAMLGLSEAQAAAVAELFGGCGRPSLVPDSTGLSPSISGLCRFYVSYRQSEMWQPLLGILDSALQAAFDLYGVRPADRFSFPAFLDGPVARLVRKPLRIAFSIERLAVALDCDAALATLRDYFERLAREFEAKGPKHGGHADFDPSGPPREPLEVQLELLDLWHASLARLLRAFKQRFRSGGATLLASADRRVFQFGAESVAYDGPLKLKVPLDLAMDPDGSFLIDVKLPDREQATHSITSLLTEVMYSLSTTHNNTAAAAAAADGAAAAAAAGTTGPAAAGAAAAAFAAVAQQRQQQQQRAEPPSQASTVQAVAAHAAAVQGMLSSSMHHGSMRELASDSGAAAGAAGAAGPATAVGPLPAVASNSALYAIGQEWAAALAEGMPGGGALAAGTAPLLQNPVVGQLCVKKLAVSLRLDEERVAELLTGRTPSAHSSPAATSNPTLNTLLRSSSSITGSTGGPGAGALCGGGGGGGVTAASADIAGRLLGCYGDLFTASLDMGWRPESEDDGAAQRPCCMLTVQSNDITRLRAEVEGLWFQSSVSPRLAVRVLQAVVIALVLKFHAADSYSIRFWNRAFNQLYEYLSRGSLDIAVCLSMRATMDRPTDRLRVELSGQDLNGGGGGGGGGTGGDGNGSGGGGTQGLLGRVCPVYLLNDVNLMTVLDSVKLLSETAPAGAASQQQQE